MINQPNFINKFAKQIFCDFSIQPQNFIHSIEIFEIFIQEVDDDSELTDDSFQKFDKSVKETVNSFRKLSNGHINNESQSVNITDVVDKQDTNIQNQKVLIDSIKKDVQSKQRNKIIKNLKQTIDHLRQQILTIENDETEKQLIEKLQKMQQPQINNFSSISQVLSEIPLMQIEQAEKNILKLNKVEREELNKNYSNFLKSVEKIISKRLKDQNNYFIEINNFCKQQQKIQQKINKINLKNQKQLKQLQELINQYEQKLDFVLNNKNITLEKIEYQNKVQLENLLDIQMKNELKMKRQKQKSDQKQKEQGPNFKNIKQEIEIESDEFDISFDND